MNNWKDYIEAKFSPISEYKIEYRTKKGDFGSYSLTHILSGSKVDFIYPDDDWKKIGDVQFYNYKTKGHSAEFWEAEFNDLEKERLDKFLEPAFCKGWSSKDFYIFKKHFHSKVYWNKNFKGENFELYTGMGCFGLLLFPFLWFTAKMMDLNLINGMKKIIIDPIKN